MQFLKSIKARKHPSNKFFTIACGSGAWNDCPSWRIIPLGPDRKIRDVYRVETRGNPSQRRSYFKVKEGDAVYLTASDGTSVMLELDDNGFLINPKPFTFIPTWINEDQSWFFINSWDKTGPFYWPTDQEPQQVLEKRRKVMYLLRGAQYAENVRTLSSMAVNSPQIDTPLSWRKAEPLNELKHVEGSILLIWDDKDGEVVRKVSSELQIRALSSSAGECSVMQYSLLPEDKISWKLFK